MIKFFSVDFWRVDKKSEKKFLKALGVQVKKLRKERNLTQNNLAFDVGVNRSQIIRIEAGEQGAGIEILKKIADTFEMSLKELFEFKY